MLPSAAAPGLAAPAHSLRKPWFIIDVQHGLGNRLRAMASAAAIARQTGRELIVLWQPDHHCNCRISDLLDYPGAVIESDPDAVLQDFASVSYSYMEIESDHCHGAPILADPQASPGASVFVRSAYSLTSPHCRFAVEQRFLKSLVPAAPVRALVADVRHPNQVAAHIRMSSGAGHDHLSYEAPDNWPAHRHAELTRWRAQSHARHFMTRIDTLIAEGQCDSLFLAADLEDTYAAFADRFGSRVTWLERTRFDRSAQQLQYALADMLLLTMAERFLASTWSSFSDLAQRLARPGRKVEQSGRDF
jgi:hypothetical protein